MNNDEEFSLFLFICIAERLSSVVISSFICCLSVKYQKTVLNTKMFSSLSEEETKQTMFLTSTCSFLTCRPPSRCLSAAEAAGSESVQPTEPHWAHLWELHQVEINQNFPFGASLIREQSHRILNSQKCTNLTSQLPENKWKCFSIDSVRI